MPAIDTQAPLMRRKALIEKLMTQLQSQGGSQSGLNAPQVNLGRVAGNARPSNPRGQAGSNPLRPENLEPRSALIASLRPSYNQVQGTNDVSVQQGVPDAPVSLPPVAPPPPTQGSPSPTSWGEPVATAPGGAAPLPTWQQQNFLSEQAMNSFNAMSPEEQARVLSNPVYRRRFYNT